MALVLTTAESESDQFQAALSEKVIRVKDSQSVHEYLEKNLDEDLLFVGHNIPIGVAADIARRYRVERPALGVLVMRDFIEVQTLSEALAAGIRELVPTDDANALLLAVKRSKTLSEKIEEADTNSPRPAAGKTILVFGAKGGCGKTTIATNLALALASEAKSKVCIVDLDLEFGDVAIYLSLNPKVTLSTAMKMQGGLDRKAVESLVTNYKPGIDAILAPTKPSEAEFITPELVVDLIQHLHQMYDYVILDAAPSFTEVTLRCFELADVYELVTTLDVPSLKNLKVAIDTLDALGYPRSKWNVVLNRSNSRVGLGSKDVEDLLGVQIKAEVPSSGAVPAALNSGKTMWESQPDHPVSLAIAQLARTITGEKVAKAAKKRNWFARNKKK
jgi:pilus assembly protein CpaE